MRFLIHVISWISLAGTIGPPVLFYFGKIEIDAVKTVMLVATGAWFSAACFFVRKKGDAKLQAKRDEIF